MTRLRKEAPVVIARMCPGCGRMFATTRGYKVHWTRMHPDRDRGRPASIFVRRAG